MALKQKYKTLSKYETSCNVLHLSAVNRHTLSCVKSIYFMSSTHKVGHTCQPDRSQMTEFFQPTTHVRADWDWVSYVRSTARAAHNLTAVAYVNPTRVPPILAVDNVTNNMASAFSEIVLHDSRIGVKETSQKDKLVSELGITEEQIAKVRILNEKYKNHHISITILFKIAR